MKRKVLFTISIIFIMCTLIGVLSACKKETTEDEIVITGIDIFECPEQYYVVGEKVMYDAGKIAVHRYNKTTGKTMPDEIVSMSDNSVSIGNKGGSNIAGELYTVSVKYAGFSTSYKYYVQAEKDAIKSVELEIKNYFTPLIYSKTEKRPYYDSAKTDDYRINEFNGLFIRVKYRDESKTDLIYDLADATSFTSIDVKCIGFDATKIGQRDLTFSYKASDFFVPYEVIENDWIDNYKFVFLNDENEYEEIDINDVDFNFLVGDKFDVDTVKVKYVYNSLNESDVYDIKQFVDGTKYSTYDPILYDFDTTTATSTYRTMIISTEYGATTINYNVYEPTDVIGMALVMSSAGVMSVKNEKNESMYMSYQEFLDTITLELVTDDSNRVQISATSDDITMYYLENSTDTFEQKKLFDSVAYDTIVRKGQIKTLIAVFNKNQDVYYADLNIAIAKAISKIEIANWSTVKKEYLSGDDFDFGSATYQAFYDDGTYDEVITLAILYNDLSNNTIIKEYSTTYKNVTTPFDMTTNHNSTSNVRYCIDVSMYYGELYIDGVLSSIDTGKLYIEITIK